MKNIMNNKARNFNMFTNGEWLASLFWTDDCSQKSCLWHAVNHAVQSVKNALQNWKDYSCSERANYLYKIADMTEQRAEEIALLETMENGKTISQSRGEIQDAINKA